MALADLGNGVPIGFEAWLTLGNLVEALVAAFGIRHLLKGEPHLGSLKILAKYIVFAVILVPATSAFVGAKGTLLEYGLEWRIWFFADALAFLTVTPAILSWVRDGRAWARKSGNYLEFAALMTLLILLGYITFIAATPGNCRIFLARPSPDPACRRHSEERQGVRKKPNPPLQPILK